MDFTDHFLNQGWVYLKNVPSGLRDKIESIWSAETVPFDRAISLIHKEYDSSTMLVFRFNSGFVLLGKYPFLSLDYSIESASILSLKNLESYYFAQDIWSNFYFFLIAKHGSVERYVMKSDDGEYELGNVTVEEESINYEEYADFILTLSERKIDDFYNIESLLKRDNMDIRTIDFNSLLQL